MTEADYIPHHQPFQYYLSTQNLQHTRPSSPRTVGIEGDPGNHQYDIHDFFDAINAGNFPGGQLSQGSRISKTATPDTPTLLTSRTSS